jgi:hypothetical protein
MRAIIQQNAKTILVSGAVAAVTAAVLAGAPALARSTTATVVTPTPVIISGAKNLAIISAATTVASLPLPAGSWAVFLRADASTAGGGPVQLHCDLVAGTNADHTTPELESGNTGAFEQNIAMNVAHTFRRPGSARFTCNSFGITVDLFSIKITAIKAGTLKLVRL